MSLWGNSDNVTSRGTVSLDYTANADGTFDVTGNAGGTGTQFGTVGAAKTGDVIRFGLVGSGGTYFGDAVITGITSVRSLTIGSTAGLSGAAIANTSFFVSELPISSVADPTYSERSTAADRRVYGIDNARVAAEDGTAFRQSGAGWVGVTTYTDMHGNFRVKSEILVAMGGTNFDDASAGIQTGANSIIYPTNEG